MKTELELLIESLCAMQKTKKTELELMIESANQNRFSVHIRKNAGKHYGDMVGIQTRNYMVYWFEVDYKGRLLYDYAYNTNSGRYINGLRIGTNFKLKMLK